MAPCAHRSSFTRGNDVHIMSMYIDGSDTPWPPQSHGSSSRRRNRTRRAIAAKAKRLKLPISELMRRGAFAYEPNEADEELGALADSAKAAAERAGAAIDDALDFIAASDKRIEAMESEARNASARKVRREHHRPGLGSAHLHGQAGGQGESPGRSNERSAAADRRPDRPRDQARGPTRAAHPGCTRRRARTLPRSRSERTRPAYRSKPWFAT